MRRKSGKRKLHTNHQEEDLTAKRACLEDQEPPQSLTDNVGCCRPNLSASIYIASETDPIRDTAPRESHETRSLQQDLNVSNCEQCGVVGGSLTFHSMRNMCLEGRHHIPDKYWRTEACSAGMHSDRRSAEGPVIKDDPDQATTLQADVRCPSVMSTKDEQIAGLCQKIHELSAQRQQYRNNEEILKKRLKQSRLTYAAMLRKQSQLLQSLEDLKNCLEADERLLSEEKRIADRIPGEIEQVSIRLANLCSSQKIA